MGQRPRRVGPARLTVMTTTPRSLLRSGLVGLAALASAVVVLAGVAAPASAATAVSVTFTNTGCRTASLTWYSGAGLHSYGTIPAGGSKTLMTYPTHRWLMDVGTMRVGSYTVGTRTATKRFDSFGCNAFTGQFVARHSGKCLNVPGWSTASGTRIIQFACGTGQGNERFRAVTAPGGYMLQNVNSGKCLTVPGASVTPGVGVVQNTCSYMRRQIVVAGADGSLAFRHSGQCLDVAGASTADHTAVVQWPCTGASNQLWNRR